MFVIPARPLGGRLNSGGNLEQKNKSYCFPEGLRGFFNVIK